MSPKRSIHCSRTDSRPAWTWIDLTEWRKVSRNCTLDFTVTDLLAEGDEVLTPVTAVGPDGRSSTGRGVGWHSLGDRGRPLLNEEPDEADEAHPSAAGQLSPGQDAIRTPSDGH